MYFERNVKMEFDLYKAIEKYKPINEDEKECVKKTF